MTKISRSLITTHPLHLEPYFPKFGLTDVTHFYHPRSYADGAASWVDEAGSVDSLTESGDNTITQELEGLRPKLRMTLGSSFFPGGIFLPDEVRSVFIVAKVGATDGHAGTAGYIISNRTSGIAMNTEGSTAVAFTGSAPAGTAELDKWHLFSVSTPASLISRFTIDGTLYTATAAGSNAPDTIRVGSNSAANHKEFDVAAVWSTASDIPSNTIVGDVYPRVKAWWPNFDWA